MPEQGRHRRDDVRRFAPSSPDDDSFKRHGPEPPENDSGPDPSVEEAARAREQPGDTPQTAGQESRRDKRDRTRGA